LVVCLLVSAKKKLAFCLLFNLFASNVFSYFLVWFPIAIFSFFRVLLQDTEYDSEIKRLFQRIDLTSQQKKNFFVCRMIKTTLATFAKVLNVNRFFFVFFHGSIFSLSCCVTNLKPFFVQKELNEKSGLNKSSNQTTT